MCKIHISWVEATLITPEDWFCGCLVTKLCLTLCDSMDCNTSGFSVHRISQTRLLEWVDISSSRGSSQPRNQTCISCIGKQILYHWATRELLTIIFKTSLTVIGIEVVERVAWETHSKLSNCIMYSRSCCGTLLSYPICLPIIKFLVYMSYMHDTHTTHLVGI